MSAISATEEIEEDSALDELLHAGRATSVVTRANWSGAGAPGVLEASFDFAGTGGPGGDFDWVIPANQTVIISTDTANTAQ